MARVDLENVSKVFPGPVEAVRGLNLSVAEGELLVLLGPSGCGKTTTLRLIAGLERPSGGEIRIGGRVVNELAPAQRDVAMVFQGDALYPHLTVERNLGFGVRLREGVSRGREWLWRVLRPAKAEQLAQRREEIAGQVRNTADLLGLDELLGRLPRQLSGGQRQRVALGRAMVRRPEVFLFDEPLSNLDAALRTDTRRELKRLHRQWNRAAIYVTHDQAEALTLGDRVAVMAEGKIQQIGTPEEIYQRPANRFVAGFVGTPPMNLIEGEFKKTESKPAFQAGAWSLPIAAARFPRLSKAAERLVVLGIRPEAIRPSDVAGGAAARVTLSEHLGDVVISHLEIEPGGPSVVGKWPVTDKVAEGDRVEVAIDPDDVYLFDPDSGANLGLPENA